MKIKVKKSRFDSPVLKKLDSFIDASTKKESSDYSLNSEDYSVKTEDYSVKPATSDISPTSRSVDTSVESPSSKTSAPVEYPSASDNDTLQYYLNYDTNSAWNEYTEIQRKLENEEYADVREWNELDTRMRELYDEMKTAGDLQDTIQYNNMTKNEDFDSLSQYDENFTKAPDEKTPSYVIDPYADITYDYVNSAKRDMKNVNGLKGVVSMINEDEKAIYNYIYATEGKEAADRYLMTLNSALKQRRDDYIKNEIAEFGEENPLLATVGALASRPLRTVAQIGQAADYWKDRRLNSNGTYDAFVYADDALIEGAGKAAKNTFGYGADNLYKLVMNGVGKLTDGVMEDIPYVGGLLTGTGEMAEKTYAAKAEGRNDTEAMNAAGTVISNKLKGVITSPAKTVLDVSDINPAPEIFSIEGQKKRDKDGLKGSIEDKIANAALDKIFAQYIDKAMRYSKTPASELGKSIDISISADDRIQDRVRWLVGQGYDEESAFIKAISELYLNKK